MAKNLGKLGILVALAAVALLAVALLTFSYSEVGVSDLIGSNGNILSYDLSQVPQSVVSDAAELAREMFGSSQDKYESFANQLLAAYAEAEDKDFVVVFNSGGWGWNILDRTPGWQSILDGIESELDDLGYQSLLLNYRRTSETTWGCVKEFFEATIDYPSKSRDLAKRVQFLTTHIPGLKVIITGESNGTVVADATMGILRNNPKVYSIQTGIPFWHRQVMRERTLVMNSNGTVPDSFSEGDIPTMILSSIKNWLGASKSEEHPGTILKFLKAPGHDYSWHYPEVYSKIVHFLDYNFGAKQI